MRPATATGLQSDGRPTRELDMSDREARLIHLFGLLAYAADELKRLGCHLTGIEVRRAILQLRRETNAELEASPSTESRRIEEDRNLH